MTIHHSDLLIPGIATDASAWHRGLPSRQTFAGKGVSTKATRDAETYLDSAG